MARMRSYVLRSFVGLLLSYCLNAQTGPLFHDCAIEGDATQTTRSDPALNLLKNRTNSPSDFETTHFDDLAAMEVPDGVSKKHRDHWPSETLQAVEAQERRAVRVTGFFLKVKLEGPESPNCHGDNQGDRDFHIWLANSADDERSDAVVVELTPRIRAQHPSWSRTNLNRLIANKTRIRVSGWVLLDPEHPDQVGKTRATIWEIHPIMMIEVFQRRPVAGTIVAGLFCLLQYRTAWAAMRFERSYALEGGSGEHRPEMIRVLLGKLVPRNGTLFN